MSSYDSVALFQGTRILVLPNSGLTDLLSDGVQTLVDSSAREGVAQSQTSTERPQPFAESESRQLSSSRQTPNTIRAITCCCSDILSTPKSYAVGILHELESGAQGSGVNQADKAAAVKAPSRMNEYKRTSDIQPSILMPSPTTAGRFTRHLSWSRPSCSSVLLHSSCTSSPTMDGLSSAKALELYQAHCWHGSRVSTDCP